MSYRVNEVFYSLQGEGARAGSANVFVRFSGCNLSCRREVEGFDCDTEFTSGRTLDLDALQLELKPTAAPGVGLILTGGEPTLQIDAELIQMVRALGFDPICVETNGLKDITLDVDWVSCSPKTAEHTLALRHADELRYVRRHGMGLPRPTIEARWRYISPAWGTDGIDAGDLAWCVRLVKENPEWRLSIQQHKTWGVR